jgi:protein-tyrosine-phosphatase/DNA-binding transcriptional ArsR family regulator
VPPEHLPIHDSAVSVLFTLGGQASEPDRPGHQQQHPAQVVDGADAQGIGGHPTDDQGGQQQPEPARADAELAAGQHHQQGAGRPLARHEALPVELARALGDPLRWRIVELLSTEQLCVAHLAEELETAQPLVSHHLKVLRQAGLIEPDRYRYWTYYRLRPAALVRLAATLGLVARSAPSGTACRRLIPGTEPAAPTSSARPPARPGGAAMPDGQLDPTSRATFARAIEALHEEFRGIYSLETIERFVDESIDRLSGARVVDFIPLFVHRFARERLRALAQAQGAIVSDVPEVLFVCVHNAGRSQMAAALLDHHAKGKVHVRSAGSAPADRINPAVAAAMDEWGIDLSKEFPKPLTDEFVRAADVVVTMGCGDACPIYPGKRYEDWELDDPAGQPVEVVRRIRDDIDGRVQQLLAELVPAGA